MKQFVLLATLIGFLGAFTACSGNDNAPSSTAETGMSNITTLQVTDVVVGTGTEATNGRSVTVNYTGWLYSETAANHHGSKFDSSFDRNQPYVFTLGVGSVIKGWDQGVAGMKVGGQRTLIIPPAMGYGERGAGGVIPPNATLIFDVELLDVK